MVKELNEDTSFKLSIKTIGIIAVAIATLVGGWYSLMSEIQKAKEEPQQIDINIIKDEILKEIPEPEKPPKPEITRM